MRYTVYDTVACSEYGCKMPAIIEAATAPESQTVYSLVVLALWLEGLGPKMVGHWGHG